MIRLARHTCGGLLTAFCIAAATMAHAADVTVPTITTMDIGNVISAPSGVTVFRVAPTGGVGVISGQGIRTSTGSVLSLVTLQCDSSDSCKNNNVKVRVGSIPVTVGRAGPLSNFTMAMNTGSLVAGTLTGTNPIDFTVRSLGKNGTASFYVGADFPIGGNDSAGASGVAGTSYYVYVSFSGAPSQGSTGGTAAALVTRALGLTGTGALNFGWIVRPPVGGATGNVAIDSDNDGLAGRHLSGLFAFNTPIPSRVVMTATGDPGRSICISIPHSIPVTLSGASDTLTVTMSSNAGSTETLNSSGSYSFGIGGSINVSPTTPTGLYTGTFTVSVAYN